MNSKKQRDLNKIRAPFGVRGKRRFLGICVSLAGALIVMAYALWVETKNLEPVNSPSIMSYDASRSVIGEDLSHVATGYGGGP
jgi:hypothetical protein